MGRSCLDFRIASDGKRWSEWIFPLPICDLRNECSCMLVVNAISSHGTAMEDTRETPVGLWSGKKIADRFGCDQANGKDAQNGGTS